MSRVDDMRDLPNHGIFDRGRPVGLWEYDPEEKCTVWASFIRSNNELRATVKRTEAHIQEQLGDVPPSASTARPGAAPAEKRCGRVR